MRREDDRDQAQAPAERREASVPGNERLPSTIRPPEPEEAPELLGERSDYPIPHGGSS